MLIDPDNRVWVRVTGAAGGAGRYTARIQVPNGTVTITASAGVNLSSLLRDLNSADDCIFENIAESGQTGHALAVDGSVYVKSRIAPWVTTDTPPKPVFSGYACQCCLKPIPVCPNCADNGTARYYATFTAVTSLAATGTVDTVCAGGFNVELDYTGSSQPVSQCLPYSGPTNFGACQWQLGGGAGGAHDALSGSYWLTRTAFLPTKTVARTWVMLSNYTGFWFLWMLLLSGSGDAAPIFMGKVAAASSCNHINLNFTNLLTIGVCPDFSSIGAGAVDVPAVGAGGTANVTLTASCCKQTIFP